MMPKRRERAVEELYGAVEMVMEPKACNPFLSFAFFFLLIFFGAFPCPILSFLNCFWVLFDLAFW